MPGYIDINALDELIDRAIAEDVGEGDHTSLASIPSNAKNSARVVIKDSGIIAGLYVAERVFHKINPALDIKILIGEGASVKRGDVAMTISGDARAILTAERLALNFLQRMSGIATNTNKLVKLLEGTGTKILDTRKTSPGMRMIEKWAVRIGGGENHRFGLYDMILLKDNHIDFAGGISNAILAARKYLAEKNKNIKIEIETRTIEEVKEVLNTGGIDIIMLDNMDLKTMKEAVKLIAGRYKTEASGGINESTIRDVALCGVDFISVGALTHSIRSLDMSLLANK